jgi:hypothetical protein
LIVHFALGLDPVLLGAAFTIVFVPTFIGTLTDPLLKTRRQ